MEVWQAAAILGVDEQPATEDGVDTFMGRPITEADKRRLAKFAQSDSDEDITNRVMREMGIHTG